jgi:hypothetical protein
MKFDLQSNISPKVEGLDNVGAVIERRVNYNRDRAVVTAQFSEGSEAVFVRQA